ncbi:MAG: hypothetical protein QOG02_204 [Gaiellales bacterium]|nr:hypothetical protein [Gaiellales bacterium]
MNIELDLQIERFIDAPRAALWAAWTDPDQLAQWFLPAPSECRVERLDITPGGALVTSMREPGGEFGCHIDGCILAVDELARLVFTTALDSSWRPALASNLRITAQLTFDERDGGTHYRALVRHADPNDRARHEQLGFVDGWGAVTEQLATLVEHQRV